MISKIARLCRSTFKIKTTKLVCGSYYWSHQGNSINDLAKQTQEALTKLQEQEDRNKELKRAFAEYKYNGENKDPVLVTLWKALPEEYLRKEE